MQALMEDGDWVGEDVQSGHDSLIQALEMDGEWLEEMPTNNHDSLIQALELDGSWEQPPSPPNDNIITNCLMDGSYSGYLFSPLEGATNPTSPINAFNLSDFLTSPPDPVRPGEGQLTNQNSFNLSQYLQLSPQPTQAATTHQHEDDFMNILVDLDKEGRKDLGTGPITSTPSKPTLQPFTPSPLARPHPLPLNPLDCTWCGKDSTDYSYVNWERVCNKCLDLRESLLVTCERTCCHWCYDSQPLVVGEKICERCFLTKKKCNNCGLVSKKKWVHENFCNPCFSRMRRKRFLERVQEEEEEEELVENTSASTSNPTSTHQPEHETLEDDSPEPPRNFDAPVRKLHKLERGCVPGVESFSYMQ